MRVGRNEPCPCGSGRKFKQCCEAKSTTRGLPRGLILLIIVIAAIAAVGLGSAVLKSREPKATTERTQFVPAPAATSSAGKVWSPEHNHWHDAAPGTATTATAPPAPAPAPAPAPKK